MDPRVIAAVFLFTACCASAPAEGDAPQSVGATIANTWVGEACSARSDCAVPPGPGFSWAHCRQVGGDGGIVYPDGYCTRICFPSWPADSENGCPTGSRCFPRGGAEGLNSAGLCLRECASQSDCRPGYTCREIPGDRARQVCAL